MWRASTSSETFKDNGKTERPSFADEQEAMKLVE